MFLLPIRYSILRFHTNFCIHWISMQHGPWGMTGSFQSSQQMSGRQGFFLQHFWHQYCNSYTRGWVLTGQEANFSTMYYSTAFPLGDLHSTTCQLVVQFVSAQMWRFSWRHTILTRYGEILFRLFRRWGITSHSARLSAISGSVFTTFLPYFNCLLKAVYTSVQARKSCFWCSL